MRLFAIVLIFRTNTGGTLPCATVPTCYGLLWRWGTKMGTAFPSKWSSLGMPDPMLFGLTTAILFVIIHRTWGLRRTTSGWSNHSLHVCCE